jgi:hypothetical protein
MKMSNLQKWFLIAAMWLILSFIIFAFYWLQIRPVNIRRMCVKKANEASQEIKPSVSNMHEIYRAIYADCCRNNGLKE